MMLVATVVGSGIMAQSLTSDIALELLCNALATGAMLVVLITILAPISGAQLNPVVTLIAAIQRELSPREAVAYVATQVGGAVIGTLIAHAMFGLSPIVLSTHVRTGPSLWLSEFVATFGLVTVVGLGPRENRGAVPWLIGLYIVAAYWFTSSTSFANPAVTIARALTDSFAGIRPIDVPGFIAAQIAGALFGLAVAAIVSPRRNAAADSRLLQTPGERPTRSYASVD